MAKHEGHWLNRTLRLVPRRPTLEMARGVGLAVRRLVNDVPSVSIAVRRYDASRGQPVAHRAGRTAAIAALRRLGEPNSLGSERPRPSWPAGYCGSVSHSDGVAVAVVARLTGCRRIGVDVEGGQLDDDPGAAAVVLAPVESTTYFELAPDPKPVTFRFCAKEAIYKALDGSVGSFDPSRIAVRYLPFAEAWICLAMVDGLQLPGRVAQVMCNDYIVSVYAEPLSGGTVSVTLDP